MTFVFAEEQKKFYRNVELQLQYAGSKYITPEASLLLRENKKCLS